MLTTQFVVPQQIVRVRDSLTVAWLAWGVVCVAWGITYELINLGDQWEPLVFTALRFSVAGLILLAFTPLLDRRRLVSSNSLGRLVAAGILMFVTGNGFVVWALQTVQTHIVAIFVAMIPIYTVILASLSGRRGHCPSVWLGLLMGMFGVGLLVSASPSADSAPSAVAAGEHFSTLLKPHCTLEAAIGVQLGCISWALGSICATRVDRRISATAVAGAQMCAGGGLLLLIAAGTGELWTAEVPPPGVVAALATLTLVGSVLAFACYTVAIRNLPVTTVALHAYLSPVVTIVLSAVVQRTMPSLPTVVSAMVVFVGVALAMGRSKQ
jgi:drug/metabolite transporter (DMT)-like permease